jgi:hypothetical protein
VDPRARLALARSAAWFALVAGTCVWPLWSAAGSLPEIEVRTQPWRTHAGRLSAEHPPGQRLRCGADGLRRIDLALVRLGPPAEQAGRGGADGELELRLHSGEGGGEPLRTARVRPGRLTGNGAFVAFEFEPVPDSAGKTFHVELVPLGPAAHALSVWVRYHGLAGADEPWGTHAFAGPVLEGTVHSPQPHLRALAFAVDARGGGGELALELLDARSNALLRRVTLPEAERPDGGYAFFAFEPVAASAWQRYRWRLALPPGARLAGGPAAPAVKTFHGTQDVPWGSALSGQASSESAATLAGMTLGDTHLPDRDLVLRAWCAPDRERAFARLLERGGAPLAAGLLLWLVALFMFVTRALLPCAAPALETEQRRRSTRTVLVLALLHAAVFQLLLPPWMGEDEPWHLEYARCFAAGHLPGDGPEIEAAALAERPYSQLQVRRRFPGMGFDEVRAIELEVLASMARHRFAERVDWAAAWMPPASFGEIAPGFSAVNHPPLHAALASLALRVARGLSPAGELRAARLLSALGFVAVALLSLALARLVLDDEPRALASALIAVWLPVHARHSAVLNNDVLAQVLVALTLWLAAHSVAGAARRFEAALLALACLLVLATKTTAASVFALALGALCLRRPGGRRPGLRLATAALGVTALAAAAFVLWDAQHNTAVPRDLVALVQRLERSFSRANWAELARTASGAFNWYSRSLPQWIGWPLALGSVLALPGVARALARPAAERRLVLLCVIALAAQLLLVFLRGIAVARYLLPAVPALAILIVIGYARLGRAGPRVALAGLAVYEGLYLWLGLVPNEYWRFGS